MSKEAIAIKALEALARTALSEMAEQPAHTATYTCGACGVSMRMEQPAPAQDPGLSETQANAILVLALDLEWTGRAVETAEGQVRTDFANRNRNIQCALEDALRNATTPQAQPAPVQGQPELLDPIQLKIDELNKAVADEREAIMDEWWLCVQADLEHGPKSLNERAAEKWKKEYPAIAGFAEEIKERGNT